MAKKNDVVMDNLMGFVRKGARVNNKSNIPTGHFDLDFAIHYGILPSAIDLNTLPDYDPSTVLGLPMGKVVELFGDPGCGKSSMAYRAVGFAQKLGYSCLWIDTEHSFSEHLAGTVNGVDLDNLYYSELFDEKDPDKNYYAEDVLDKIIDACKSGIKVVVLDSIPNLIPKMRFETESQKILPALMARMLAENFGKVTHFVAKHGVCLIVVNHIRTKPGVRFGDPEDSPAGYMLKHNCSLRIRMTHRTASKWTIFGENEDGSKQVIGAYAGVNIVKNRMAKPLLDNDGKRITLDIPIFYEPYFPNKSEMLFDMGRKLKIISVRKGVFTWEDIKEDGKSNFINKLEKNKMVEKLLEEVKIQANENGSVLPPELIRIEFKKKSAKDVNVESK